MVVLHTTASTDWSKMYENNTSDTTFVQALHDKYVDQEAMDNELVLPKDRAIRTHITLVGFGKVSSAQKQLKNLVSIDLSSRYISSAGDLSYLGGGLNRVRTLDISRNNLTWNEIIRILHHLPSLRELTISGNQLNFEEQLIEFPENPFPSLHILTIGLIKLDWTSLVRVLPRIWTNVNQIDLWNNNLTAKDLKLQLTGRDDFIQKITTLRLSQNDLCELTLSNLGPLDNIVELDLSWCKLKCIEFGTSCQNIRTLNVSNNNIRDCSQIAKLNALTNLKHLICFDNPFYIDDKLSKNFTIARIKSLDKLNREPVSVDTRRDSEILYVRKLFPHYKEYKLGKNPEFISCNPRYQELADIYGLPEDVEEKVQDKYITVTLRYNNNSQKKKLPTIMCVSNLQTLCRRLFRLKSNSKIKIECCGADPSNNYSLDSKEQTLHFYSVKDGQILLITEID